MFHYDITQEDTRMVATSRDGINFHVLLVDNTSGETKHRGATKEQVDSILLIMFCTDLDVIPSDMLKLLYRDAETFFKGIPHNFRLIP